MRRKRNASASNPRIRVSQGIVAEWGDGFEDPAAIEDGTALIGQDGKLSWICEIASQAKPVCCSMGGNGACPDLYIHCEMFTASTGI